MMLMMMAMMMILMRRRMHCKDTDERDVADECDDKVDTVNECLSYGHGYPDGIFTPSTCNLFTWSCEYLMDSDLE